MRFFRFVHNNFILFFNCNICQMFVVRPPETEIIGKNLKIKKVYLVFAYFRNTQQGPTAESYKRIFGTLSWSY